MVATGIQLTSGQETLPLTMSKREVARELGVSVRHVERMVNAGAMPSPIRLGRRVRFSRRVIEEWLERKTRQN